MRGWKGFADKDLEAASNHYRERGKEKDNDKIADTLHPRNRIDPVRDDEFHINDGVSIETVRAVSPTEVAEQHPEIPAKG